MPMTDFKIAEKYKYQNGFHNYHEWVDSSHPVFLIPLTLEQE